MSRIHDDEARRRRVAVPCKVCGKDYYPGLADDDNRPVDASGKKVKITMAELKGYCSVKCQLVEHPRRQQRR